MKTEIQAQQEQFDKILEKGNFTYLDKWMEETQNIEPHRNILAWAVQKEDIKAIDMILQKGFYTVNQLGESLVLAEEISLRKNKNIMTFPLTEGLKAKSVDDLKNEGTEVYDFLNIKLRNMETKNPQLKNNIATLREQFSNSNQNIYHLKS